MIARLLEKKFRCTRCGHELDTYLFDGCYSMLGPRVVVCPKCHQVTPTDRFEWAEMNWLMRGWYVMLSVIYSMILSMMGATSIWCLMYFWFDAFGKKLGDSTASALPGMILGGGATVIIQVFRVWRSSARSQSGAKPAVPSFWIPDVGLKAKVIPPFLLVPIAGFFLSLPVKWLVVGWGR